MKTHKRKRRVHLGSPDKTHRNRAEVDFGVATDLVRSIRLGSATGDACRDTYRKLASAQAAFSRGVTHAHATKHTPEFNTVMHGIKFNLAKLNKTFMERCLRDS